MAEQVVNRRLNIYIDSASAEASLDKLTKQEEKLVASIEKGKKAGKDMTRELELLGNTRTQISDVKNVIEGKMLPSLKMAESAVRKLRNELKNIPADSEAAARKLQELRAAEATLDAVRKKVSGVSTALNDVQKSNGLMGKFQGLPSAVAGVFAVGSIVEFGKAIFNSAAQFQKFESILRTSLGSQSEASKALAMLTDFAKSTPFQLEELTNSFIQFANRGVKLTKDELTNLGDLAASQGKSFGQLTEAILDAQTGEFERLKEFGIRASASGNQVAISFKNQTIEVEKNDKAIRDAIVSLGRLQGIAGGMEAQSQTLGGQLSNLLDAFGQLAAAIGLKIAPVLSAAINGITSLASAINSLTQTKSVTNLTTEFESQIDTFIGLRDNLTSLSSRYEELRGKTNLTTLEQQELKDVTNSLAREVPLAVTEWDKYGNAISVNTGLVREYIEQQRQLLQYQNADQIRAVTEDLEDFELRVKTTRNRIAGFERELETGRNVRGRRLNEKELESRKRAIAQLNQQLKVELDQESGARAALEQLNGDYLAKREQQRRQAAEKEKEIVQQSGRSLLQVEAEIKKAKENFEKASNDAERKRFKDQLTALEAERDRMIGKETKPDPSIKKLKDEIDSLKSKYQEFSIRTEEATAPVLAAFRKINEAAQQDIALVKQALLKGIITPAEAENALKNIERVLEAQREELQQRFKSLLSPELLGADPTEIPIELRFEEDAKTGAKDLGARVGNAIKQAAKDALKKDQSAFESWFEDLGQYIVEWAGQLSGIYGQIADIRTNAENAAFQQEVANNEKRIESARKLYESNLISEKEYNSRVNKITQEQEKREKELRKRQFERDKNVQTAQALMSAAQAIVSTLAARPGSTDIISLGAFRAIQIGIVAATTAAQVAAIRSAKPPQFERGGFVPAGPSHASGGIGLVDNRTGAVVGEVEGGEPIISRKIYAANKPLIDSLIAQGQSMSMNIPMINSSISRVFENGGFIPQVAEAPGTSELLVAIRNLNQTLASGINAKIFYGQIEEVSSRLSVIRAQSTVS